MQKLILLLLIAPLGLVAQSNTEAKRTHQQVEDQLMRRYPQAKKIDIEALNIQQKEAHKKCATCGKNNGYNTTHNAQKKTMQELLSDQQRLIAIIKNLHENESTDVELLKKYKKALSLNLEKIKTLESTLDNVQEKQKQIALKKAAN